MKKIAIILLCLFTSFLFAEENSLENDIEENNADFETNETYIQEEISLENDAEENNDDLVSAKIETRDEEKSAAENDLEISLFLEQMKSAMRKLNYKERKSQRDVYLSLKLYDYVGAPGYIYFGSNIELGAISYRNNILLSGEMCGGFYNWGAGFNLGFLAELPNEHLIISGISTGFWFAMNFYNDANNNNEDYSSQFMFGGPFAKYLIGKNKRFFEVSARALMGWADKYYESSDSYGNRDSKTAFLINFNIGVGLTVLF
ncbi:MAG: hypothetical protein FWF51_01730 [Chitinivibrionia bacterium]|nr:hypothetical protein [Chitinivibrionia bacterium]